MNIYKYLGLGTFFFLFQWFAFRSVDDKFELRSMTGYNYVDTLKKTTLYNHGKKPCSCASNLENLFDAWPPENIDNASDLKLISYTYRGAIQDREQIDYYAALMTTLDSPFSGTEGSMRGDSGSLEILQTRFFYISSYREILDNIPQENRVEGRESIEKELSDMRAWLIDTLKVGYKIFSINFEFTGKLFENFVFCDPDTSEIVVDMLFMNL